ncbi:hypothetical protein I4U23_020722 [Adineta vaga]|nr:hypothetical protein I4U23_020722 [Adineta vaga]
MSLKRPLSPESNNKNNSITNDVRQLKRFKLHSIIQELQNEEAKLVLLKKLRASQQLSSSRTNKNLSTITNGFHSPTTTTTTTIASVPTQSNILSIKSTPLPITNPISQPQPIQLPTTTTTPVVNRRILHY